MARPPSNSGLTLAQLQRLMRTRHKELNRLNRQRDRIQKKLEALDAKIDAVSGGAVNGRSGMGGVGRRARNAASLQDTIHQVLSKSGGPMNVGDIAAKVTATGYRS